jgi:uncharacterized membrane protein
MEKLSNQYLNSCKREDGFIIRGGNMTRLETVVDAAFAFAITMLVISIETIPRTPTELFHLSKDIPAFLASGIQIGYIWYRHSIWSRRFGLEDAFTTFLSLFLVMLVLIFLYPIKMVFIGMFAWLSDGYLLTRDFNTTLAELANLFVYFAAGFVCLSIIFYLLYWNTLKNSLQLGLTKYEEYYCKTESFSWVILSIVAITSGILAKTLSGIAVVAAGFSYMILWIILPIFRRIRKRNQPEE